MRGFQKGRQVADAGKTGFWGIDQGRYMGWNGKIIFSPLATVTTLGPAILMFRVPKGAELSGKALTLVAMAGHAMMPVEIATPIEFSGVGGECGFPKRVVSGGDGGRGNYRSGYRI